LINDILDLSKIESGMMAIESARRPSPRSQTNSTAASINWRLTRAGVHHRASGEPATGHAHRQKRLQQILKNLLSNAFKFTEKGRVSLNIRCH
jgi:signal transduction histidine kinase